MASRTQNLAVRKRVTTADTGGSLVVGLPVPVSVKSCWAPSAMMRSMTETDMVACALTTSSRPLVGGVLDAIRECQLTFLLKLNGTVLETRPNITPLNPPFLPNYSDFG